jgi:hypothetical protein
VDFDEARSQFETTCRTVRPSYTDADFADYRRARAWTAWKQEMWERVASFRRKPKKVAHGASAMQRFDIASMNGHGRAMIETADV